MNDSDLSKQELLADILHTSLSSIKNEISVSNKSEKTDTRQTNQTTYDEDLITDENGRLLIT